jgi:predicted transcriptional regulator of viral defense system
MKKKNQNKIENAKILFKQYGGTLRTCQVIKAGIHRRVLYEMRDTGILEKIGRGLYRLKSLPPLGNPDLALIALKVPNSVISLISSLSFHEITTQIPHEIYLALPRGAEPPRLEYPPVKIFWFTGRAFTEGIETQKIDDIQIRVYNPEKTLADCFKYRNKIGMDTVIEALKLYSERKKVKVDELIYYSRICRVEKIMRPYLESII